MLKTKFILLGLFSETVITSAWLSSDGVNTDEKSAFLGCWQGEFDTYQEAVDCAERIADRFPEGIEIRQVLMKSKK